MQAEIKWLDNPEVFRVNQIPAHSDHSFFDSKESLEAGDKTLVQCLNGDWKFSYAVNAAERKADFYKEGYDYTGFDMIKVPGHIELAGYDRLHYINTMYPWDGMIHRKPAYTVNAGDGQGQFSEAAYNPVGSYVKEFDLEAGLVGKRVCICFEGVEQAMYLWLNGQFVGYAEDTFTPSEFDLTPYIKETGNVLAVEVHKRSTAAYLEDQDFFRFFGIFRNVSLYAKPAVHVEDMWAKPVLNADNETGAFSIDCKLSAAEGASFEGKKVNITLKAADGTVVFDKTVDASAEFSVADEVGAVTLWDNHNPYLYQLLITVSDENGVIELVPYKVGFRRVEMKDKMILLNGKRHIITGVNRHEWNCRSGRCITLDDMIWDIELFKANNINSVRTCHYPDQIAWYYLCDENGIYMMSETNLESHGSWQKMGGFEPSWNVPGSVPQWKAAVMDRAKTNFETFKNHTAILFWSLGNESWAGDNLAAMNKYFKDVDPSRLVHYEGVVNNRVYEDVISDMESRMYATPAAIEEYLSNNPKKPFILCEYMHDMGNSLGGLKSYMDLLDKYPLYQGGYIWDYIDQALMVVDEITGEEVLRYGGDFDDKASDYEFSGNGIVFADRTEKPALQEVKYYYGLYK